MPGLRRRKTRSQLIRAAIDEMYLSGRTGREKLAEVIEAAAGAWKGRRESGAEYVDRLRSGRLRRQSRRAR